MTINLPYLQSPALIFLPLNRFAWLFSQNPVGERRRYIDIYITKMAKVRFDICCFKDLSQKH